MQIYDLPGPKAKAIIERDSAVISPSYARAYPFVMDHGKGSDVWDVDGNHFLDFASGIAVTATGHSHPKVVQAIKDQSDKFLHISADFYHEAWVSLGERLDQIAPFKEDAISFMTNSGTESVEAAIKLARYHTGASQFIGFLGAFHGRTLGSLSFTASKPLYHEGFYPLMNGVVHVPYPDPYRPGYIIPPPGFYPALRDLCDRHDILLIVDEVQSGMGRTGKWWAIEHFGIEPDIVCVGKGIASGIPLGAIIARKSIVSWPLGSHGNTYGGNPIACAAALATMDLIQDEYLQNAQEVGDYAIDALNEIAARHPSIGEVRGKGLMIGVEFVKNKVSKEPAHDLRERIVQRAFERGLISLGCGKSTIRISPSLSITKSEIDDGLEIFEESITLGEKEFQITHVA
jgi:4-aminobutyrate aminotransferase